MSTYKKGEYMQPTTHTYLLTPEKLCIGFGEGSIPPEDSDSNMGWFEEEPRYEGILPKSSVRLWEEQ